MQVFETIIHALRYRANENPDRVCLIEAETDKKITYKELWDRSISFSEHLKTIGVQKGDRIVVRVVQGDANVFISAFAAYLAGAVWCPVERNLKPPRIAQMLEYFETKYLISTEKIEAPCVFIDFDTISQYSCIESNSTEITFPNANDMCDIIFTTGTTGKAKGVMLSYYTRMETMKDLQYFHSISKDDVLYKPNPVHLVGAMRHFGAAILSGATMLISQIGPFISYYDELITKYYVTIFIVPISTLRVCLNEPEILKKWRSLRLISIFYNAPMHVWNTVNSLIPSAIIYNELVPTEVGSHLNYNSSMHGLINDCVGRPRIKGDVELLDDNFHIAYKTSKENPGRIAYKRDKCMLGYWKDEKLTMSVIKGKWLVTSDLAYKDKNGCVRYVSRIGDVINTGGNKVAPYELENLVSCMPGVRNCVCVPVDDEIMGQVPYLFVEMFQGFNFFAKEIHYTLSEQLESYKLPRKIIEVDYIPLLGESGKIDKEKMKSFI